MARTFLHEYMPVVRNLSDKSVITYKQSIYIYLEFLHEVLQIENRDVCFESFERNNIKKYVIWLQDVKKYAPKTIALKLTGLKSLLKYCEMKILNCEAFIVLFVH